MYTVKILLVFPIMCLGVAVGIIYTCLEVGFYYGQEKVTQIAEQAQERTKTKTK